MQHVVIQITSPCGVPSIRLCSRHLNCWSTFDCHEKISLILWHNKCFLQHWNSYYNWLVVLMLMIKPVQKGGQNKTHCCIYIQYSLPFWRLFQVLLRHFRSNVRVILAVTLWRHPTNLVQPTPPRGSVIARIVHNLNRLIWKKMLTIIAVTYKFIKLVSLLKIAFFDKTDTFLVFCIVVYTFTLWFFSIIFGIFHFQIIFQRITSDSCKPCYPFKLES